MILIVTYLFVTSALIVFIVRNPSETLRPSVWFSILMTLFINGGATFSGEDYGQFYEDINLLRLLSIVFPLGVITWCVLSPKLSVLAQQIYRTGQSKEAFDNTEFDPTFNRTLNFLLFLAFAIIAFYLANVPLMSTGLVTIFTDPVHSSEARENSLKLLDNQLVKYTYSLYMNALAPFIIALLTLRKSKSTLNFLGKTGLIVLLALGTALTGARMPLGSIAICLGIVQMLQKGIFKGFRILAFTALATIAIVTSLTILREGNVEGHGVEYMSSSIIGRALVVPFEVGVWANRYVQDYGPIGVSNIRPLAILLGQEPINFPNLVGLAYYSEASIDSISANCCFLFDFQASFGLIGGWMVALICLILLDFALLPISRLKGKLSVACTGVLLLTMLSYTSSGFTTSLVTQGTLFIILVAWVLRNSQNTQASLNEGILNAC